MLRVGKSASSVSASAKSGNKNKKLKRACEVPPPEIGSRRTYCGNRDKCIVRTRCKCRRYGQGRPIKKNNGKMQAKCRNKIFLMNRIGPRKIEYLIAEHKYIFQSFIKFRKAVTVAGISSDVQWLVVLKGFP